MALFRIYNNGINNTFLKTSQSRTLRLSTPASLSAFSPSLSSCTTTASSSIVWDMFHSCASRRPYCTIPSTATATATSTSSTASDISATADKMHPYIHPQVLEGLVDSKDEPHFSPDDTITFRDRHIKDVLQAKATHDVHFINQNSSVYEAIQEMKNSRIGALIVQNDNREVVGIITERDYMNKVTLEGLKSQSTQVKQIMTTSPRMVSEQATVVRCMTLMTHYRFRHLIVTDRNKKVIGIVSIGDLVKAVIEQYKETITFLREYIEKRW